QKFAMTPSITPCPAPVPGKPTVAINPVLPRCTQADFSVTFSAKAEPSSFLASKNSATGSHTFAMAAQAVVGARYEIAAVSPPLPPIKVQPGATLPATLTAKV